MPDLNTITRQDIMDLKTLLSRQRSIVDHNALDEYQRLATKTAIYPGVGTALGLEYVALKGAGEAGEFAEHVGKAMRDDGLVRMVAPDLFKCFNLTDERKLSLIKEVGDQLWYLAAKCNELGIKLSEAAVINLEKLCDRIERGKLSGSGDNR